MVRTQMRAQRGAPVVDLGILLFPALIVLLLLAPLLRGLFFPDNLYPFIIAVCVLAILAAVNRTVRREDIRLGHPMDWVVLAYAAGYFIADMWRPLNPDAAREGALLGGGLLIWYWTAAHLVTPARLRAFARAVFSSGVMLAVLGCLAAGDVFQFPFAVYQGRILSTLQYANALGAWMIASTLTGGGLALDVLQRDRVKLGDQLWLGVYGAGIAVMVLTLLGTYSRGAWLFFGFAVLLWLVGVSKARLWEAAVSIFWPSAIGLLFSRATLDMLNGAPTGQGLVVVGVTLGVGGGGLVAYHSAERRWRQQLWAPAVRIALKAVVGLYAAGVGMFVLWAGANAALTGRQGILASAVVRRAQQITVTTPSVVKRLWMWRDALRLIHERPLLGFGGGGWAAVYHSIQSWPYWSLEIHDTVLQAWVEGGLLAAAGAGALGVTLFTRAWNLRKKRGEGTVAWGMAVGCVGLWAHSLIDWDLAVAAAAFLMWAVYGAVRGSSDAACAGRRARWWTAVFGLLALGGISGQILIPTLALATATRTGAVAAAALADRNYAGAYLAYEQAVRLDPLDGTLHADLAQLLVDASEVAHDPVLRREAVREARQATHLDPGDLEVQSVSMDVAVGAGAWPAVTQLASSLLTSFPLDPQVYDAAGFGLIEAGEGALNQGDFHTGRNALRIAATLQLRARRGAVGQERGPLRAPVVLDTPTLLAEGEADAMLGESHAATVALQRLAIGASSGSGNPVAAAWFVQVLERSGHRREAAHMIRVWRQNAVFQMQYAAARQYMGFAAQLRLRQTE